MRPSRILKIASITLGSLLAGLVVLVGIVVYGMYYLEDPTRGEFLRNLVFEERAYEVTVDLVAEGEPVTITRTVNCVPYFRTGEFRFGQSWKPTLESFGKRLKSGDAVFVVAPRLCGVAVPPSGKDSSPIPINDEYLPLIRWVDNPDRPTVIEDYISEGYFGRPGARVHYRGVTARAVPYKSSAMDFEELDGLSRPFRTPDSAAAYGYVAWPILESEWSTDEVIAKEIGAIEHTSALPLELSRRLIGAFSSQLYTDTINRGQGLVSALEVNAGQFQRRRGDLNQIVPLSFNDDAFELDERKRGVFVSYPKGTNPSEGDDPTVMKLRINGETLPVQFTGIPGLAAVYVPESKIIYQLAALSTNVPGTAKR